MERNPQTANVTKYAIRDPEDNTYLENIRYIDDGYHVLDMTDNLSYAMKHHRKDTIPDMLGFFGDQLRRDIDENVKDMQSAVTEFVEPDGDWSDDQKREIDKAIAKLTLVRQELRKLMRLEIVPVQASYSLQDLVTD